MPCPPLRDLLNPGIEPGSPALQVDSLPSKLPEKPYSVYFDSSHREPGEQGSPSLTEILPVREANPSCKGLTWDALLQYLLGILLCLHPVYIAVFGMAFLYSGSLWSSLYCCFLTVGGVVRVACQGFLVREACVSVLVGGAGFLLSGVQ